MGRLENIIARNERKHRPRERVVVSLVFGLIVIGILVLMVFTNLGKSPEPAPDAKAPPHDPSRADGILLRRAPPAHR